MRLVTLSLICVVLAGAAGCGKVAGSAAPVDVETQFNRLFGAGRLQTTINSYQALAAVRPEDIPPDNRPITPYTVDRDACFLDQLRRAKKLSFEVGSEAPWYRLNSMEIASNRSDLTIDLGHRIFSRTENPRSWTEGSRRFYATTVFYQIGQSRDLPAISSVGLFSIRMIFVDDPAQGQWAFSGTQQVDSRLTPGSDSGEVAVILSQVAPATCDTSDWHDELGRLRSASLDAQQSDLSANGVAASGSNLVRIAKAKIELYPLPSQPLAELHLTALDARAQARQLCSTTKDEGGNWHLASVDDLTAATTYNESYKQTNFSDTPDQRLWGGLLRAVPRTGGHFAVDSPLSDGVGLDGYGIYGRTLSRERAYMNWGWLVVCVRKVAM